MRPRAHGLPAIFLSGGLDSIAIAPAATDELARRGAQPPLALSLGFPKASNEESIQRGVAQQLGLEHGWFSSRTPPDRQGCSPPRWMTADWPQPMWNIWSPAYVHPRELARLGRHRRPGDPHGPGRRRMAHRLAVPAGGSHRSRTMIAALAPAADMPPFEHRRPGPEMGACSRVPLTPAGERRPRRDGTQHVARGRRRRLLAERPDWIAPDPAMRTAMDARVERVDRSGAAKARLLHARSATCRSLHPGSRTTWRKRRSSAAGTSQRVLHPFWDVDLVSLLYRVPPDLLMQDGRSKWLLRRRVAKRLPGLGLEQRVKVNAHDVFSGIIWREIERAWRQLGGLHALARAGVLSSAGLQSVVNHSQVFVDWAPQAERGVCSIWRRG